MIVTSPLSIALMITTSPWSLSLSTPIHPVAKITRLNKQRREPEPKKRPVYEPEKLIQAVLPSAAQI
jgi:hypothetical protein